MHFSRLSMAPTEIVMMRSEWKCRDRPFKNLFFVLRWVVSLFIWLFFACCNALFAQQFGGNPPTTRWMQIDTDTVRVIFPEGMHAQANRVTNTVHYLSKFNRRSIGDRNAKVSITLQNQTTLSNGYVGLAPFRSEFFTTPPQSPYFVGSNWLDLLSIHEYRHVLQFVNGRVGITNLIYYITGELGWSTLNSIAIPDWFWEGDAVVYETALTSRAGDVCLNFTMVSGLLNFRARVTTIKKSAMDPCAILCRTIINQATSCAGMGGSAMAMISGNRF
jgi:hypothetical protein